MRWLLLPLLVTAAWGECSFESVADLRSAGVKSGFDPAKLEGLWYEQLYSDFAQGAAKCQELNFVKNEMGGLDSNFSVIYNKGPFSIEEHYDSKDVTAVYRKHVSIPGGIPGGKLIGMPTAVVDVIPTGSRSKYDAFIMYSCWGPMRVVEIATREAVVSETVIEDLMSRMEAQNVPIARSDLKRVDRSTCQNTTSWEVIV